MPPNGFRYLLFVCFICLWSYLQAEFVIETRDVPCVELSNQMDRFITFTRNRSQNNEKYIVDHSTSYLLQEIQQFRQILSLDSLVIDTILCRAAAFHNQEMLDYNYRSTDFQKDGFPFQGMLLYGGSLRDYTSYSFVLETTSLAEMEQQFFAHDSLRQVLQDPQVNCIGLAASETKSGYLCTIYLSERYLFFKGSSRYGGDLGLSNPSTSHYGKTSLLSASVKVYYHPFHPKEILRIEDIDTDSPIQERKITIQDNGDWGVNVSHFIGPTQVLVYYDEQNRPIALGYQHGRIQEEYYIDEEGTRRDVDKEEENQHE